LAVAGLRFAVAGAALLLDLAAGAAAAVFRGLAAAVAGGRDLEPRVADFFAGLAGLLDFAAFLAKIGSRRVGHQLSAAYANPLLRIDIESSSP
jgi:hypothetical protein